MEYIALGNGGTGYGKASEVNGQTDKNRQAGKKQPQTESAFYDMLEEKSLESEVIEEAAPVSKTCTNDMSMEEYKCYIYYLISRMPKHPSQRQNDVMVLISKEGLAAMKQNPEYEAWVLKDLQNYFSQNQTMSAFFGKAEVVIFYGAKKEECYSQVRYPEYEKKMERKRQEERYRERREAMRKRLKKLQQKKLMEQKALKKLLERRYLEKRWLEQKRLQDEYLEEWVDERAAYESRLRAASMERRLKERSLFY
ncbi:MAG: hypothetical protein K2K54_13560 [Lachnospiraceae bacterium]|nr:hypothetical protein [Lachnospiraceae bacterium]